MNAPGHRDPSCIDGDVPGDDCGCDKPWSVFWGKVRAATALLALVGAICAVLGFVAAILFKLVVP